MRMRVKWKVMYATISKHTSDGDCVEPDITKKASSSTSHNSTNAIWKESMGLCEVLWLHVCDHHKTHEAHHKHIHTSGPRVEAHGDVGTRDDDAHECEE